ncbi:VanW family protein [Nocardioides taihuensis]|uniref:VanW family protein n=1 Tax=Nocardioides taihuensis TaxID=1835606 RepID=A0ABW0BE59_9ACTN
MKSWDQQTHRQRTRILTVILVVFVLFLAGGYYGGYRLAGDKVPRGTTISGVEVGGLTRSAAITELEQRFADRGRAPIAVQVERGGQERSASVRLGEIGLAVDAERSIDAAGAEASLSPVWLWNYYTGGSEIDAVVNVDEERLRERLAALSAGLGTPPRDGAVTFSPQGVTTTHPATGEAVDTGAAREALTAAYLGGDDTVELPIEPVEPDIDEHDVREALRNYATPAMSAPVTLVLGKSRIRLEPRQYADALSMVPHTGELVPAVDWTELSQLVDLAVVASDPVDATVVIVDGRPQVVPAESGLGYRPSDVVDAFLDVITSRGSARKVEVQGNVVEPDLATSEARELGIEEKVSEFTTYYPHADYRNVNLGRAAELIDGTVLEPGDGFSLNGIVGERTVENGFTEGYVINDGILVRDLGGGVSQMATTTFNAMFFAGLEDIEHKAHSFYIDRYPVGREATVAWPSIDLRFRNDTPYGVLIKASRTPSSDSAQGSVTVQMWSTKYWDIDSRTSERYNYRPPRTRTLTTPDCEPNAGWSGFDVDVTRVFRRVGGGTIDHTELFHTSYTPADTVVCEEPGRYN